MFAEAVRLLHLRYCSILTFRGMTAAGLVRGLRRRQQVPAAMQQTLHSNTDSI